jgi:hypothetical protein
MKYKKVPQPYLKHTGSLTERTKFTKTTLKKFCHTKNVGDRAILTTYLNSAWQNT